MNLYKNAEGYRDPTAGMALAEIGKAERKALKQKTYKPLVYICSPYAGDIESNVLSARRYSRYAALKGYIPIASHLLYPQFLDDGNPKERELGLFFGNVLMSKCAEVWIFSDGEYSAGMKSEYDRAIRKGMKIRYFTTECEEVKAHGEVGANESL